MKTMFYEATDSYTTPTYIILLVHNSSSLYSIGKQKQSNLVIQQAGVSIYKWSIHVTVYPGSACALYTHKNTVMWNIGIYEPSGLQQQPANCPGPPELPCFSLAS